MYSDPTKAADMDYTPPRSMRSRLQTGGLLHYNDFNDLKSQMCVGGGCSYHRQRYNVSGGSCHVGLPPSLAYWLT